MSWLESVEALGEAYRSSAVSEGYDSLTDDRRPPLRSPYSWTFHTDGLPFAYSGIDYEVWAADYSFQDTEPYEVLPSILRKVNRNAKVHITVDRINEEAEETHTMILNVFCHLLLLSIAEKLGLQTHSEKQMLTNIIKVCGWMSTFRYREHPQITCISSN